MRHLILALAAIPFLAAPSAATACARSLSSAHFVAGPKQLPRELKEADWVFQGQVLHVERPAGRGSRNAQIKVKRVWKGKVPPYVSYREERGCEHFVFTGSQYVFFAKGKAPDVVVQLLNGGTAHRQHADKIVEFLGRPKFSYQRELMVR